MRVLQLGPFPPPHGGVQTHIVALRDYLRRHDVSCDVVNITGNRKANADGVYYPRSAVELLAHLLTRRYDVVHLHVGGHLPLRVVALALVCGNLPRTKAVFTFHSGGYPSSPEGRSARPATLRGVALRCFESVIGVNQEVVNLFLRFGVGPARAHLIEPHAVVVPTGAAAELQEPLRGFFAAHDPVLLSVGLLEPEYDLGLQITALRSIRESFPNAGLVIIGSGGLHRELQSQIAACSEAPHILLPGDVPHAMTLAAIARCDALLRTTLYDGDAISVREALSLGTPVIATDNGMRPPGVRLFPARDEGALVASVLAVAGSGRGPRIGSVSGAEENVARVLALYRQLVRE